MTEEEKREKIEQIAEIVYYSFPFEPTPLVSAKPDWVPNGNSVRQDDARFAATAILALLKPVLRDTP